MNGDVISDWSVEATTPHHPVVELGYELTNVLHVRTQSEVIRQELLFAVGDTLDSLALIETERNLRGFGFISDARVTAHDDGVSGAVVRVRTTDNFSFAPGVSWQRVGERSEMTFHLSESNVFGFGKSAGASYMTSNAGNSWSASYSDPRIWRTPWTTRVTFTRSPYGDYVATQLTRPFRSSTARSAHGGHASYFTGDQTFYRSDGSTNTLQRRWLNVGMWTARAWGPTRLRRKTTARAAVSHVSNPRDADGLTGDFETRVENAYEFTLEGFTRHHRRRNLDDFGVTEDVREGWRAAIGIGPALLTGPASSVYGRAQVSARWTDVAGDRITVVSAESNTRLLEDRGAGRATWSHLVTRAWIHHYYTGLPAQTLAASVNWYGGWGTDRSYWVGLGGSNGLRGYKAYQYGGTRRLLVNIEDRVVAPTRLLTLGFGVVGFFDAGYVWNAGDRVRLGDLRSDAGMGLRIYNTRAPTARVTRIDYARPLRGGGGWLLSIGTEQTFTLMNYRGATVW